jgi:hypothetical protein
MSLISDIREFLGRKAFVPWGPGAVEGLITGVEPYRPDREITLENQIQLSTFRLEFANGHCVLVGGCFISGFDGGYDEHASVTPPSAEPGRS